MAKKGSTKGTSQAAAPAPAVPVTETEPGAILNLDPSKVRAAGNSRFGLKETRLETLSRNIVEQGGILQPVRVVKLATPDNGFEYDLRIGFYRHAAIQKLNAEGAGLPLPAIVEDEADPVFSLKRQLAENVERENQSPMDMATSMRQLQELGVSNVEIRNIFSRVGYRKGRAVQPLSNAMLNIYLSFLEFPKNIQEKIHDGRIGVAGAYELSKQPREKWPAIVERLESDRVKAEEQESKDEERLLEQQRKVADARKKEEEAAIALQAGQKDLEDLKAQGNAAAEKVKETYGVAISMAPGKEKKAADEAHKKAEAALKEIQKAISKQQHEVSKLSGTKSKVEQLAAEKAKKLAAARAAGKKDEKKKGAGPKEVQRAAAAEGSGEHVKLNASEMRAAVHDMALPGGPPKVMAIGKLLEQCFNGVLTTNQMCTEVSKVTGEYKAPKK